MTDAERADALRRAEAFGIDLGLLRQHLALTPTERLRVLTEVAALADLLRSAPRLPDGVPTGQPDPSPR